MYVIFAIISSLILIKINPLIFRQLALKQTSVSRLESGD